MTKHDGRGRPPIQADIGKRLMLRDDQGTRYRGILKTLTRGGAAIILLCYGDDWMTYTRLEHATVTGAEVLDDG